MADGSFPGLVSRNRDVNAVTNEIYVGVTDGTDQLLIDASGRIDVGNIATSVTPGTAAANLGKAVDSAAGGTDTGVAALVVRDDALTTLTPVDGDYVRLRVDSTGALWTHPTTTGDMSNIFTDDSAFTVATDTVGAVGMLADETTPDSVDEGDIGIPRMTLDRKQLVRIVGDSDANRLNIDANGDIDVANITTSVTPGTGATNLGKAVDSAAGATDTVVAAGVVRDDTLTTLTPVDGDYTTLRVDSTGALWVNTGGSNSPVKQDDSAFTVGTDYVSVSGFLADETTPDSVDEGDTGAARMTLDRKQLMVLTDATTDSQRLAINASGEAQVDVAAHALTNANALPVSKDNSANSETNPIFVQTVNTAVSGEEVHDYDTASAVAADGTSNHDYTVAGTTFFLKSVVFSGSGSVKAEIQTGPLASLATVAVGFLNGRQGDTQQIFFDPPVEVPVTSTGTVRVIRTNRQGSATDVYSTIIGYDV